MCWQKRLRVLIWLDIRNPAGCGLIEPYAEYAYILSKVLGTRFQLIYQNVSIANIKYPDGRWSGVIGMIQRDEIDLALRPFVITEERKEVVDFTYPYRLDKYSFATKHPEFSPEVSTIVHPFTSSTWITLAVFLFLVHLIYLMVFYKKYSSVTLFVRIFAALTGQGMNMNSRKLHERLLILSWMVGTLFLTHCYKSVLLSFLTVPTLKGVRNLAELSEAVSQGKYTCVVRKISYAAIVLRDSDIGSERIIADNIQQSPTGYGGSEVLLKNPRANVAYIGLRGDINHLTPKFFISKDYFAPVNMGFAVGKNLPCKEEINRAILKIMASGLFDTVRGRYQFCRFLHTLSTFNESETPLTLDLPDFYGAFILLTGGYVIGAIALIAEMFW